MLVLVSLSRTTTTHNTSGGEKKLGSYHPDGSALANGRYPAAMDAEGEGVDAEEVGEEMVAPPLEVGDAGEASGDGETRLVTVEPNQVVLFEAA